MSAYFRFDRESFQTLLASAFGVQKSGMNKQSLSALIEIHNAIAKEELAFETILDMIADRARIVADATGIAIGLLTRNQLVYRAGSGSGAQYIGQRVTAVLSPPAHTGAQKEILRVENAENDSRIEAAICREFDANALLMVPMYKDQFVAGVLEILFRDAHTFDDGEMLTYRMMANLVEEALAREHQLSQRGAQPTQVTTPQPYVGKAPTQVRGVRGNDQRTSSPSVIQVCNAPATSSWESTNQMVAQTRFVLRSPLEFGRRGRNDPPWSGGVDVSPSEHSFHDGRGARIVRSNTSEE